MIRSQIPTSINSDRCFAAIIRGGKKRGDARWNCLRCLLLLFPPHLPAPLPFHWMNVFRISESLIGTTGEVICDRLDARRAAAASKGPTNMILLLRGSGTLWISPDNSPRISFKLCMSSSVQNSVNSYALNGLDDWQQLVAPADFFFPPCVEKHSETKIRGKLPLRRVHDKGTAPTAEPLSTAW